MKATTHLILPLFVSLCLLTACSNAAGPVQSDSSDLIFSTTPDLRSVQGTIPAPMTPSEFLLSILPNCDGVQIFEQPVVFDWPLIEQRIQELEGSDWGYYGCPQSQEVVSTFYREEMPKTPYLMTEINWVERPQGTLGVYYQSVAQIWLYLWIVPQPVDPQTSYVIVAESDTEEFVGGECRLIPLYRVGLVAGSFYLGNNTFLEAEEG